MLLRLSQLCCVGFSYSTKSCERNLRPLQDQLLLWCYLSAQEHEEYFWLYVLVVATVFVKLLLSHFCECLDIAAVSHAFCSFASSVGTSRQELYVQMTQARVLLEVKWHLWNRRALAAVVRGSTMFV